MKPVIAIINDHCGVQEEDLQSGVGGSETWVIEISKQFSKNGYYVMVFQNDPRWIKYQSGVEYIPMYLLEFKLSYIKFDHIIICRYITQNSLNILSKYINNINHISWMVHDVEIAVDYHSVPSYDDLIKNNICLKEKFHKFICLTNFGKSILQYYLHGLPDERIVLIGNGINFNYQVDDDIVRDNNLFWSSRWERGLELLTNDILPLLKKDFPNIKIYVAQYTNTLPENLINHPDIVFLGNLEKKELYKEMNKHKVSFYPNFYPETFCISILENILCGEELITTNEHGPATTLRYFNHMLLPDQIDYSDQQNLNNISLLIASRIKNYYNKDRQEIRTIMKNYILNEYSWENIFLKFKTYILNG